MSTANHCHHIAAYYERLAELTAWQEPESGNAMLHYFILCQSR